MTCREVQSLLQDYIDNSNSCPDAGIIRNHLDECEVCRAEYDESLRLKKLLSGLTAPNPGNAYFEEVKTLVLARTVESADFYAGPVPVADRRVTERSSFIRSIVSVAASICIFLVALSIDSNQSKPAISASLDDNTVMIRTSLGILVHTPLEDAPSLQEQERVAGSMLLLGPPGLLGRSSSISMLRGME